MPLSQNGRGTRGGGREKSEEERTIISSGRKLGAL